MEETPRSARQTPLHAGQPPASGWYLARGGQTFGPYAREALEAGVGTGQVGADDQLWSPELGAWHPASSLLRALSVAALPAADRAPSVEAWKAPLSDAEAWKAPIQSRPVAGPVKVAVPSAAPAAIRSGKSLHAGNSHDHRHATPFNSMSSEMGPVAWGLGFLLLTVAAGAVTSMLAIGMDGPGAAAPTGVGRDSLSDLYWLLHFSALAQAGMLVLVVALVTRWLSHAHDNLAALVGEDKVGQPLSAPRGLPGVLVGPCLWLAEIWLRSSPDSRSRAATGFPRAVSGWLGWTLAGLIAGSLGISAALGSAARSGSRAGLVFYLATLVLVVLAAAATRRFESDVARRQDKRHRELTRAG